MKFSLSLMIKERCLTSLHETVAVLLFYWIAHGEQRLAESLDGNKPCRTHHAETVEADLRVGYRTEQISVTASQAMHLYKLTPLQMMALCTKFLERRIRVCLGHCAIPENQQVTLNPKP